MKEKTRWGFVYTPEIQQPDGTIIVGKPVRNRVPNGGLDHLTGLILGTAPLIDSWYVGLFENNYIPNELTTAADIPVNAGETTAYVSALRPLWTPDTASVGVIDNLVNRAEFEFTQDKRLYGGFLISSGAKGTGNGLVFSIARFNSPVDVTAGSTLRLRVGTIFVPG